MDRLDSSLVTKVNDIHQSVLKLAEEISGQYFLQQYRLVADGALKINPANFEYAMERFVQETVMVLYPRPESSGPMAGALPPKKRFNKEAQAVVPSTEGFRLS